MPRDPCTLHEPEAALAMWAVLSAPFMTLRRIVVQLSGLMLLSSGRRGETRDGIAVSLAALRQEIADVQDALREVAAARPSARVPVMAEAAADIARAVIAMEPIAAAGGGDAGTALALLQRAQRRLLSVSDDRAGMAMVGFAHACCCGPNPQSLSISCR